MAPTANPTRSVLLPVGCRPCIRGCEGRCKGRVVVTNCPAWIYLSRLLSRYQNETIIRGRRPTWNQLPLWARLCNVYAPLRERRRNSVSEIRCFSFQARLRGFRYADDNILKHVYSSYHCVSSLLLHNQSLKNTESTRTFCFKHSWSFFYFIVQHKKNTFGIISKMI